MNNASRGRRKLVRRKKDMNTLDQNLNQLDETQHTYAEKETTDTANVGEESDQVEAWRLFYGRVGQLLRVDAHLEDILLQASRIGHVRVEFFHATQRRQAHGKVVGGIVRVGERARILFRVAL